MLLIILGLNLHASFRKYSSEIEFLRTFIENKYLVGMYYVNTFKSFYYDESNLYS